MVLSRVLDHGVGSAQLQTPLAMRLAALYKQLQAPVGEFGLATLSASTGALAANDPGDRVYRACDAALSSLGAQRNVVAGQILELLHRAQLRHVPIKGAAAAQLLADGQPILARAISTREYCN
jgi:hypothetical protein